MIVKCWLKDKSKNIAKESEVSKPFMVNYDIHDVAGGVQLVGNGCSNHMTSMKSRFKGLDEA